MASTYENDLRLEEMATGENSGSWGTKTNTNLELVADAFSYGTEIIANADTAITIADGAADAARSLALKITSSEDLTTTRVITLGPNTTSKVWIIENSTSGGQTLTISAGSGSNVTLPNGVTKIIATDGIGAGSNVTELYTNLHNITIDGTLTVDGILSLADGSNSAPSLTNTGDTNTGLYFPADEEVGITTGGTQQLKVSSTGIDITSTLAVGGDVTVSAASQHIIIKGLATTSDYDAELWLGRNDTRKAIIRAEQISANSEHDLVFFTNAASADATEKLRLGSNGAFAVKPTVGGHAVFNEDGVDADFRVESSNHDYAFFVDGASGGVQMGDSDELTVGSPGHGRLALVRTNGAPQVNLFRADGSIAGGDSLGNVSAFSNDTNGNAILQLAQISFQADGTFNATDNPTKIVFSTTPDASETMREVGHFGNTGKFFANFGAEINTSQNNPNGDFKVSSSGDANMLVVDSGLNRVGIGTASPVGILSIEDSGNTPTVYVDGNSSPALWTGRANRTDAGQHITQFAGKWNDDLVARMVIAAGDDTTNKDDGRIVFYTAASGTMIERQRIEPNGDVIFNDTGIDADFRVESDAKQKMLFVDGGENVVAMGMLDNYTTPSWIGTGSVVMADNFYQFQGANTGDGVWNQSVDTNQSYHMHNAYYSGGWKQHVANVSATMYQSGSGLHRFQVANASSSTDASISWRPLLNMNEAAGFDWNPSDYSTADFRVRSDSHANMLFVDAGQNSFQVGSYSNKDGNIMSVGGSQGQTYSESNIEGQLGVSLVNNTGGNGQHSSIFFRVSANNGSNNAQAAIGLRQPTATSHNSQLNFQLRSQTQNQSRPYLVLDSETGAVFNTSNQAYIDFKVESANNANMFVVDSSADRVQIGSQIFGQATTVGRGQFVSFNTNITTVSASGSVTTNLFTRSPDSNVAATGTVYISAENSGGSIQVGCIIDFFFSNGTLSTTARETGSSQGTMTFSVQENGDAISVTVAYAGGLGGAIRFNAGGHASIASY